MENENNILQIAQDVSSSSVYILDDKEGDSSSVSLVEDTSSSLISSSVAVSDTLPWTEKPLEDYSLSEMMLVVLVCCALLIIFSKIFDL